MREYFEKLQKHLRDNNINGEYDWSSCIFSVKIKWGDWKHDHLRCDYLVEEFAKENNHKIFFQKTKTTEDDGSDCYSATHFYIFEEN